MARGIPLKSYEVDRIVAALDGQANPDRYRAVASRFNLSYEMVRQLARVHEVGR